jgi:hypothetical protein
MLEVILGLFFAFLSGGGILGMGWCLYDSVPALKRNIYISAVCAAATGVTTTTLFLFSLVKFP